MSKNFRGTAVFQGEDGVNGFKFGDEYTLNVTAKGGAMIVAVDPATEPVKTTEALTHENMNDFLSSWNNIKFNAILLADAGALTFGEMAVGITFNPGKESVIDVIKRQYANLIDRLNDLRNDATVEGNKEKGRMYSIAITEAQSSQMWAVKAITWKY